MAPSDLFPSVYFKPAPNASETEIITRMQELAEEYELVVHRLSDKTNTPISEVRPKPQRLFLEKGGVRIPKYLHVYKDEGSPSGVSTSMTGGVFTLPHPLLGQVSYFGVLVDESKGENMTPNCSLCNDTGVIVTGNNDLPCSCPAGDKAQFNVFGVIDQASGQTVKKHFLNNSPEPVSLEPSGALDVNGKKLTLQANILVGDLPDGNQSVAVISNFCIVKRKGMIGVQGVNSKSLIKKTKPK